MNFVRGKKEEACPYYGAKAGVEDAQVIVAPYNILLLKESRDAYGIKLKDNVVIIDEAHNLLETESSIHSAEVSQLQVNKQTGFDYCSFQTNFLFQLKCAQSQLTQYLDRYKGKLSPANLLKIRQLLQVLARLLSVIGKYFGSIFSFAQVKYFFFSAKKSANVVESVHTMDEFLDKSELVDFNLLDLATFAEKTRLAQKVGDYRV
jgi:chromosome transmission fidelity protein 1